MIVALAWPFVALVIAGIVTFFLWRAEIRTTEIKALETMIGSLEASVFRKVGALSKFEGESTAELWKVLAELRKRVETIEVQRLGRVG